MKVPLIVMVFTGETRDEVLVKLWITRRVNVEIGEITFLTNGIWPRF